MKSKKYYRDKIEETWTEIDKLNRKLRRKEREINKPLSVADLKMVLESVEIELGMLQESLEGAEEALGEK